MCMSLFRSVRTVRSNLTNFLILLGGLLLLIYLSDSAIRFVFVYLGFMLSVLIIYRNKWSGFGYSVILLSAIRFIPIHFYYVGTGFIFETKVLNFFTWVGAIWLGTPETTNNWFLLLGVNGVLKFLSFIFTFIYFFLSRDKKVTYQKEKGVR